LATEGIARIPDLANNRKRMEHGSYMGLGILHWGLGGALKRYAFWMGVTGAHSLGRFDDLITVTAVDLVPRPNVGSLFTVMVRRLNGENAWSVLS